MPKLRHYKFRTPELKTFYVPVHNPKPFDKSTTLDAQLFAYFKNNGYDPSTLTILETSTKKVRMRFMVWYLSRQHDLEIRAMMV